MKKIRVKHINSQLEMTVIKYNQNVCTCLLDDKDKYFANGILIDKAICNTDNLEII